MSAAVAVVVALLVVSAGVVGLVMNRPKPIIPEPMDWVPFTPTWSTVKTTTRRRVMSRPNDPYPKGGR